MSELSLPDTAAVGIENVLAADPVAACQALAAGELEVIGQLTAASNLTLYTTLTYGDAQIGCIYKPIAGERPLWDFPDGTLANREYAAFLVSEALGWRIVPPTVLRDGPFGFGMAQLWIDVDDTVDVVALLRNSDPRLLRIAIFDALVNNADRKGGHILPTKAQHLFGIDHGVCFSDSPKLRTVLWNWAGEELPDEELAEIQQLRKALNSGLHDELSKLLTASEVTAFAHRIDTLLTDKRFPLPSEDRPAVPWPPL